MVMCSGFLSQPGQMHLSVGLISTGCFNGIHKPLAPMAGAPSSTTASLKIIAKRLLCEFAVSASPCKVYICAFR